MSNHPRLGIIDLGTNTFHLLLVEKAQNAYGFRTILRERHFVNLADSGIETISAGAWDRAMEAMNRFKEVLDQSGEVTVKAVGTAAMRRADNAPDLCSAIHGATGIEVEVISGEREADYIARGVTLVVPDAQRPVLIVDIGGGSVEIILHENGQNVHSGSFPIGVAVLYSMFHHEEPIDARSLTNMENYLSEILEPVLTTLPQYPTARMVGASGTFEVLDSALRQQLNNGPYAEFVRSDFEDLYANVVAMNLEERLAHPKIPNSRARYIVVAMELVRFLMARVQDPVGGISQFAMKEGIAKAWLNYLD